MGKGGEGGQHHGGMSAAYPDFSQALPALQAGRLTPRELLERYLGVIAAREAEVKAFVTLNLEGARQAADAATARYRAGRPLSAVDGCPVGVKDIMDTFDLPTQMGTPIYASWQPRCDAACVHALRRGGAVIVGKTVTTAFATGVTNQTCNPHDLARTPGGSSSGSAAAVGAGMLPVALGTQTQGSTLRPASYCGAVGFKPTHGVLSMQGVHPISLTHDHLGVIGATLDDTWRIASHISLTQGSPGQPFLDGAGDTPPAARQPRRLIRLYTKGWESEVDVGTRAAFEALIEHLQEAGVEIVGRDTNADVAALEAALDGGFTERSVDITAYEMKWPYEQYARDHGNLLEPRIHARVARAAEITPQYYAELLAEKRAMRDRVHGVMAGSDGFITLAASGPAPVGHDQTGSRTFLLYSSFLGLPAFSLPLMQSGGLPVGVQLMGAFGADGALAATARWLAQSVALPV